MTGPLSGQQGMEIKEMKAMQQATIRRIDYSQLVQDGRHEEAKQLYFDDAAWTITSPIVNIAHRLFDEARRNRPESMFGAKAVPTELVEGDVVPMTSSREQAVLGRVKRAVTNHRSFGNNNNRGTKPF